MHRFHTKKSAANDTSNLTFSARIGIKTLAPMICSKFSKTGLMKMGFFSAFYEERRLINVQGIDTGASKL